MKAYRIQIEKAGQSESIEMKANLKEILNNNNKQRNCDLVRIEQFRFQLSSAEPLRFQLTTNKTF